VAYGSMRSTASCEQEKRSVAPAALTTGVTASATAARSGVKYILTCFFQVLKVTSSDYRTTGVVETTFKIHDKFSNQPVNSCDKWGEMSQFYLYILGVDSITPNRAVKKANTCWYLRCLWKQSAHNDSNLPWFYGIVFTICLY
jgi:hypothetical protein